MEVEELQKLSDVRLNEIAAIQILWGGIRNVPADEWKPTEDMNQAMRLLETFRGKIIPMVRMVEDESNNKWMCEIWGLHSTNYQNHGIKVYSNKAARAITIAAILANESVK